MNETETQQNGSSGFSLKTFVCFCLKQLIQSSVQVLKSGNPEISPGGVQN